MKKYHLNALAAEYDKVLTNVDHKYLTINGLYFYHQQEAKEKDKIKAVSDFVILRRYNTSQLPPPKAVA